MSSIVRGLVAAGLAAALPFGSVAAQDLSTSDETMSLEAFDRLMTEVSNAGRWGPDDELGTLNLVSEEVRRRALAEVRDGATVSMSRDVDTRETPSTRVPMEHDFTVAPAGEGLTWALDAFTLDYHGWSFSHVDALSHASYRDRLYNDVPAEEVDAEGGARRLGVETMRDGIVSRGVLVDVPRLRDIPYMEPGDFVTVDDLEAWEERTGVRVRTGDVLLIRTGRWAREADVGPWALTDAAAGPHPSVARWLKERGVAVLGGDNTNERYPSVVPPLSPLHLLALSSMGMPLLDNLDLERVAREAADRNRWTFLFVGAPLPVERGTGSPLNPLAIF